jgi:creatinine amidohydrolase/Fe(II)-dependent formamide hydrolase-like protein
MSAILRRALLIGLGVFVAAFAGLYVVAPPLGAPLPDSVFMEELTWVELRAAVRQGKTIAIVPTGGIEQGGPHLALGKHNDIVREAAGRIARELGTALVAPVVAYVPEGGIDPPTGHMKYPGTIGLPEEVFAGVLEAAARSLRVHGFTLICFIGDHGGSQAAQATVAERLDAEWARSGVRVLHVGDYYAANGQVEWLRSQGEMEQTAGDHAGVRDTSELMAVNAAGVRIHRLPESRGLHLEPTGVVGNPAGASAERGAVLIRLKVEAAVRQIRRTLAGGA